MENWKDIPGYEGAYQVSDIGRVKSLSRTVNRSDGKELNLKEKILKTNDDGEGREKASLCLYGKMKTFRICQLMAIAFLNHIPNGMKVVVDHIDGDKSNDKLSNLQLISSRENTSKDRWRTKKSKLPLGVQKSGSTKNPFVSQIRINGKLKHIGMFKTIEQAAKAYESALSLI